MLHRLFCHCFYWLNKSGILDIVFKSLQIFFASSCAKFYIQTCWWKERFKQVHRNYFIWLRLYFLTIPTLFFIWQPHNRTYIFFCSGTDIKEFARKRIFCFDKGVSQHQTNCMLLFIISLLHTVHKWCGYLDLFYAHCTHQMTVCSVACNKLEISGRFL